MAITIETGWKRVTKLSLCTSFHASTTNGSAGSSLFSIGAEPPPTRILHRVKDRVPFTKSWSAPDGSVYSLRASGQVHALVSSNPQKEWAAINGPISYAALSFKTKRLFISFHVSGANLIDRIDLATGSRRTLLKSKMLHEVTVNHRGELVHWPVVDFGSIESINSSGKSFRLTDFGWYPAFSKKGDMAFLMGDHTLWLRTPKGLLSRVASSWSPRDSAQVDFPTWCPCGRHVAALIGGDWSETFLARDLVIADVASRKILLVERAIVDPAANRGETGWSGESAWIV